MMGGRVAEEIVFGEENLSMGCSNDLEKATEVAKTLAREISFRENGDPNQISLAGSKEDYSEKTNEEIDEAVEHILRQSLMRTRATLQNHQNQLEKIAKSLFSKETMTAEEIRILLGM